MSTELGHKAIEDIEIGDKVWAYNEETGEQELKEVVTLFRNKTEEWIHVHISDEHITCTKEHPFYIPDLKQWINAGDLELGMNILLSNGNYDKITSLEVEHLDTPETTYNFEVRDLHNYYVGESNVLVHNKCINTSETFDTIDDALSRVDDFLGPKQYYYKDANGIVNQKILVSKSDPTRIARFDIDPTIPHVQKMGQHINLEQYAKPFGFPGQKPKIDIHVFWRT